MGPFVNGIKSGWLLGPIVYMWFTGLFDYMGQHLRIVLIGVIIKPSELHVKNTFINFAITHDIHQ